MLRNHKTSWTAARLARATPLVAGLALVLGVLTASSPVHADDTIRRPGDHPAYNFEVEPHLILGIDDVYATGGWGAGVRFGIPIVDNGFVDSINDSVAITFGVDLLHYDNCWYRGDCVGNYVQFPVALQWNFYVAKRFSAFGEPGLVIYHGFFDDCPGGNVQCPRTPHETSLELSMAVGARYYLNDKTALTLRVGFPSVSFGVSFFP